MADARRCRQAGPPAWWSRVVFAPNAIRAARAGDAEALALIPLIERFTREAQAADVLRACLLCDAETALPASILGILCPDPSDLSRAVCTPICDPCGIKAGAAIGKLAHSAFWARLRPPGHA